MIGYNLQCEPARNSAPSPSPPPPPKKKPYGLYSPTYYSATPTNITFTPGPRMHLRLNVSPLYRCMALTASLREQSLPTRATAVSCPGVGGGSASLTLAQDSSPDRIHVLHLYVTTRQLDRGCRHEQHRQVAAQVTRDTGVRIGVDAA